MTNTPLQAMQAAKAADVRAKREAVEQALADALAEHTPITVGGIARRAGVSRQFIYNHPDLKAGLDAALKTPQKRPARPANFQSVETGLKSERQVLAAKTERQRATIQQLRTKVEDLETQRRRWLGSQLAEHEAVSPEEHAEMRLHLERVMEDNRGLTRRVSELERLNAMLAEDLQASRAAHADDMARSATTSGASVTSITRQSHG